MELEDKVDQKPERKLEDIKLGIFVGGPNKHKKNKSNAILYVLSAAVVVAGAVAYYYGPKISERITPDYEPSQVVSPETTK